MSLGISVGLILVAIAIRDHGVRVSEATKDASSVSLAHAKEVLAERSRIERSQGRVEVADALDAAAASLSAT